MAAPYWLGGSPGNENNWGTAGNWSTGSVPVTGDTPLIDGRSTFPITAGMNQSAVTLARLTIISGSPSIGTNVAPLQIGATILDVNVAPTDGSNPSPAGIINLATGTAATTCTVYDGRSSGTGGVESVIWKGTHTANVLRALGGIIGVATCIPGDTATVASILVSGNQTRVRIGSGVTLASLQQTDGTGVAECAMTTLNQDGGTLTTRGTGAITTAYVSGTLYSNSTGAITNLHVEPGGVADFSLSIAARTVTNATITGDGRINANLPVISGDAHPVTFTTGVDCIRGAKSGQVDFGGDITVTASAV